jgi:hypothetical protein
VSLSLIVLRSYYKYTHLVCSIGKHVESASYDVKSVIMKKREGHNHEVRAARNSGHVSDGSGSALRGQLESFNFLFRIDRARTTICLPTCKCSMVS